MYTPYLLVLTMFAGASELVDPSPHLTVTSCQAELLRMQAAVENEWAAHGILRTKGECREHDPTSWNLVAGQRSPGAPVIVEHAPSGNPTLAAVD